MRKRHKLKRHSCALCKSHKMSGSCRWKGRDLNLLKVWERERKELLDKF